MELGHPCSSRPAPVGLAVTGEHYLKAVENAVASLVKDVLVQTQTMKTFPWYMGTADIQATARKFAYDFRKTLEKELERADHLLRADLGLPPDKRDIHDGEGDSDL